MRSHRGPIRCFLMGLEWRQLTLNVKLQSASSSGSGKICPDCPRKTKMLCDRAGIM